MKSHNHCTSKPRHNRSRAYCAECSQIHWTVRGSKAPTRTPNPCNSRLPHTTSPIRFHSTFIPSPRNSPSVRVNTSDGNPLENYLQPIPLLFQNHHQLLALRTSRYQVSTLRRSPHINHTDNP